MTIGQ